MSNPTNSDNASAGTDLNDEKETTLYDFTQQGMGSWRVEDDVVMGGRSDSKLEIREAGPARFFGHVSLENDGGFCSIHQTVEDDPYIVAGKSAFKLRLQGDGKDYNFRVRTPQGRHAYAYTFPTKGGVWETISIPFNSMEATYHGEPVEVPNYAGENIMEMQVLIGNGSEEHFELLLDAISVL